MLPFPQIMRLDFLYIFLSIGLLSSCAVEKQEAYQFNSSIDIISGEVIGQKTFLFERNEQAYYSTNGNTLKIVDLATNVVSKSIEIEAFEGYRLFSIANVNDSIIYVGKTPIIAGLPNGNEDIFLKLNVNTGKVIESYSIHHPQFTSPKENLKTSADSTVTAFPFGGLVHYENKLFFPVLRWIGMSDSSYFNTSIPVVAYYDLEKGTTHFLDIYPPKPKGDQLLNTRDDIRIVKGHENNLLVYFAYTDTIVQYDLKSGQQTHKRTELPLTKNVIGINADEVLAEEQRGVFHNEEYITFYDLQYIEQAQRYWRFGKVEFKNATPIQKNNPAFSYTVYDTAFNVMYTGVLPNVTYPNLCKKSPHELYLYSAERLREKKVFHVELNTRSEGSYKELENFEQLGKQPTGWNAYLKNVHQFSPDTIRTLVVPEYSCPACVMAVLTGEEGLEEMNKYGYNVLLLSSKKYVSQFTDVQDLEHKIPTRFDSYQYMSYLESFTNPKLLIIVNGKVMVDKYLDPEDSQSLKQVIRNSENQLRLAV